jgi:ornithine cyclodeaminase
MAADFPVTEFGQVLAGSAAGRENDDQVTVFDSVGFALEDYSTLRVIGALSAQLGLGEEIALVPTTDDPKDLFHHLLPSAGGGRIRRVA